MSELESIRLRSGRKLERRRVADDVVANDVAANDVAANDVAASNDGHNHKHQQHQQLDDNNVADGIIGNGFTNDVNTNDDELNTKVKSNEKSNPLMSSSSLVLWRSPFKTVYYFICESIHLLLRSIKWILCHTRTCLTALSLVLLLIALTYIEGPHQRFIAVLRKQLLWCLYWCGLGILSSVGLGTGLHTFLLYLGPHIASVTLAAYECDSLDFPSPPYPDEIVCPTNTSMTSTVRHTVSVLSIMSKVRLEAFMWGAGTALGELPPYFVARAHRLAGEEEEDIDPQLAQEITGSGDAANAANDKPLVERFKTKMIRLVTKVGFFGILACASIPNPLFDLAGITCGYSLVPFWTFFGATLIGKAVIKMHIQKLFVIVAFNENYVESFVKSSRNVPIVGKYLHEPLREFLVKQKESLHRGSDVNVVKGKSWLSFIFDWVVISMIAYFVVSIINSMAQNYHKRLIKYRQHQLHTDNNKFEPLNVKDSKLTTNNKRSKSKKAKD